MDKAELLWLWHDYHTEMFDQSLSSTPDPRDDGAVIVSSLLKSYSNHYAGRVRKYIYEIAKLHSISKDSMDSEKKNRLIETTRRRLEKYEWVNEHIPHDFEFIKEYLRES